MIGHGVSAGIAAFTAATGVAAAFSAGFTAGLTAGLTASSAAVRINHAADRTYAVFVVFMLAFFSAFGANTVLPGMGMAGIFIRMQLIVLFEHLLRIVLSIFCDRRYGIGLGILVVQVAIVVGDIVLAVVKS